jgi:hypothetical protein
MVFEPGVAKLDILDFVPPRPPNVLWPKLPPKAEPPPNTDEPPPNADVLELPPRAPNPLPVVAVVLALEAKLGSLLVLLVAAANGDFALEFPRPPKGEADEEAKDPKPDALNLSSLVCGRSWAGFSGAFDGVGFADIDANGEDADIFAKPLLGGICGFN